MPNTPKGLPYPVATDPVSAGAANIQALAAAVDLRLPSIGTSLPASPVDGQLAILVDNVAASTYEWLLRYNAGASSAHKWEFVGGAPLLKSEYGDIAAASSAWVRNTPTFPNPRPGVYDVTCYHYAGISPGAGAMLGHGPGAWGPNADPQWYATVNAWGTGAFQPPPVKNRLAIAAADQFCFYIIGNAAGTLSRWRALEVLPVRLS